MNLKILFTQSNLIKKKIKQNKSPQRENLILLLLHFFKEEKNYSRKILLILRKKD